VCRSGQLVLPLLARGGRLPRRFRARRVPALAGHLLSFRGLPAIFVCCRHMSKNTSRDAAFLSKLVTRELRLRRIVAVMGSFVISTARLVFCTFRRRSFEEVVVISGSTNFTAWIIFDIPKTFLTACRGVDGTGNFGRVLVPALQKRNDAAPQNCSHAPPTRLQ
jgi:hypothetical protein